MTCSGQVEEEAVRTSWRIGKVSCCSGRIGEARDRLHQKSLTRLDEAGDLQG